MTGHPAVGTILGTTEPATARLDILRRQHASIWELVHASRYAELAPILAALIPGLEAATRTARGEADQATARELLGEIDAAWIAADRAGFCAQPMAAKLAIDTLGQHRSLAGPVALLA